MSYVHDFLKNADIAYEVHDHPAVFTVEEAARHRSDIVYGECKNLFLRNKKGNKHFLVTISGDKNLDLDALGDLLGEKIGFASKERLVQYLGLTRGAVSPFGLINDREHQVQFILDKELLKNAKLGFHPNVNTQTLIITSGDLLRFLEQTGHVPRIEVL